MHMNLSIELYPFHDSDKLTNILLIEHQLLGPDFGKLARRPT